MRRAKIYPGLRPLEWLVVGAIGFCLALSSCYTGIDAVYRESLAREQSDWRQCVNGMRFETYTETCRAIAARIVREADAAEGGR